MGLIKLITTFIMVTVIYSEHVDVCDVSGDSNGGYVVSVMVTVEQDHQHPGQLHLLLQTEDLRPWSPPPPAPSVTD